MEKLILLKPYVLILGLITLLTGIRWALMPIMHYTGPFTVYFVAVALAAIYGGARLTLFTVIVCATVVDTLFIQHQYSPL